MKALCLILAYLMRVGGDLKKNFEKDMEFIMQKAPYLIQMMIEMTMTLAIQFKMKQSRKRITAKNVITLIEFSQNMI